MEGRTDWEPGKLQVDLQSIAVEVRALAENYRGDTLELLALLRTLEALHREIRDGLFQASLPDNRQALYKLLRTIEAEGGWPYIHRMKLRSLLDNWLSEPNGNVAEHQ
ncbi:MAG: hypothetical protein ACM37W_27320 [Actinomycetota bacterium]